MSAETPFRLKRRHVIVAVLSTFAFMWATWGCTPRQNFDAWIARQSVVVKAEPVPCNNPAFVCGSTGGFDPTNNIIYLDPVAIAQLQATQDRYDPSVSVLQQVYYHEWGHVADRATGFQLEGASSVAFEHAAQCVMQIVTGRAYTFFANAFIYWICPDADLARARWILTANHII
jgi:hypothetical protein